MTTKIHAVFGRTGAHDAGRNWLVVTCSTQEVAESWRKRLQKVYDAAGKWESSPRVGDRYWLPEGWKHPLDPNMQHSYWDTVKYYIEEVDFTDVAPPAKSAP